MADIMKIKVKELIAMLADCGPDEEVLIKVPKFGFVEIDGISRHSMPGHYTAPLVIYTTLE